MQSKVCRKCGQPKDTSQFPRAKQNPDGFHRWCKDCSNAQAAKRYSAKRAEVITRVRQWQEAHPERFRATNERYRQRHADAYQGYRRRSNAKRKGATLTTLDHQEWAAILADYNNRCAYCSTPGTDKNPIQQDHIVPLARGGQHTKDNVIPACRVCNRKKGNKTMAEFLRQR